MTAKTAMERKVVFTLTGLQLVMELTRKDWVSVEFYAGMWPPHASGPP